MMEAKGFLVLLAFGFLSTALGWQDCSLQLVPGVHLPITCNTTSYDCSQITCSARFSHEIRLSVDINQWQDPMTAYVTLSVPELGIDWSASFKDGENIEIPGFPLQIEGFPIARIDGSIQVSLKKGNGTIDFKVDLMTWAAETHFEITLVEGKIPEAPELRTSDCGGYYYFYEFQRLPTTSKILIITSVATFLILVLLATLYCCKSRKATTADHVKVKPPSYDEATSTNTKVPMQLLINEI